MESMDIQIIDEASKSDIPIAPRKKLIVAIGFVLGLLISFGYGYACYRKLQP